VHERTHLRATPLPCEEPEGSERRESASDRLGDRPCLFHKQCRGAQLAGKELHVGAGLECECQFAEGAVMASHLHVAGSQDVPGLIVQEIRSDHAGEPEPGEFSRLRRARAPEGTQRLAHR
jgi:hypothetical protein